MFFHLYKYRLKTTIRNMSTMFWSLCFPILLGTLFFFGLSKASANAEQFEVVRVAVVTESATEANTSLLETMKTVQAGNDKAMFAVLEADRVGAEKLLSEREVSAIVILAEEPELIVKGSGINQTITQQFLAQYQRMVTLYTDVAAKDPSAIAAVTEAMSADTSYLTEVSLGGEKLDSVMQYFYALFAMACLYGSWLGLDTAESNVPKVSTLAARRFIAPTHHMKQILADMLAAFTMHGFIMLVLFFYMTKILGVDMGQHTGLFLLVCLIGSIIGVCIGQFIGCITKKSKGMKIGVTLGVTMTMSTLSGLMSTDFKYKIEQAVPFVNRINPAALITDCFYCLNVYSDYERFLYFLAILAAIAVLLLAGCFFTVRRSKYDSI